MGQPTKNAADVMMTTPTTKHGMGNIPAITSGFFRVVTATHFMLCPT
jgi:hypothetical protein